MKKMKKIFASVLSLAMISSVLPSIASANYEPTAGLEIVQLGPDTTYGSSTAATNKIFEGNGTGWKLQYALNATGITPYSTVSEGVHITTSESHSGHAAAVVNMEYSQKNRFFNFDNGFTALDAAKTYRVSFWTKGAAFGDNTPSFRLSDGTTTKYWHNVGTYDVDGMKFQTASDGTAWKKYYMDVTGYAFKTLRFTVSAKTNFLLDDIEIREVTKNGDEETLGDNLITNGGFENYILGRYESGTTWSPVYTAVFGNSTEEATTWTFAGGNATGHMKVVSEGGRTGNNALYVYRPAGATNGDGLYQNMTLAPGTYTFSYWVRGWRTANNSLYLDLPGKAYNGWEDNGNAKWFDWQQVTKTFTISESTTKLTPWIKVTNTSYLLIDDVALYKDGDTTTNLIKNGSFEDVIGIDGVVNPVLYPIQAGGAANLTWTNPRLDATSAKITVDGTEREFDGISLTKNAFNEVLISGLENGKEHTVALEMVVNGKTYTETMKVTPTVGAKFEIGSWTVNSSDDGSGDDIKYANFAAYIDKTEKNGDACLRFDANIPNKKDGVIGIKQTVKGLSRGKLYKLKFDYKTTNMCNFVVARNVATVDNSFKNMKVHWDEQTPKTCDWTAFETEFVTDDNDSLYVMNSSETYDATVTIGFSKIKGSLWIDNIGLYELDEDGNVGTENLLAGGDFSDADGYSIDTEFVMMDGNEETVVTTIPSAGDVHCKVKVKNYNEEKKLPIVMFAALYDGNTLKSVEMMETKVSGKPILVPADEYSATVTVPALDTGDYSIKLMVWDSSNGMKPLLDKCGEISE